MSNIFNISEATSIAMHSITIIAKSGKMINVDQIADKTNFSKNHIAKVLQQLTKNNFIDSERGPKGGFIPNKKTFKLTLLDIYELIEGKLVISKCILHEGKCPFNNCLFDGLSQKYTIEFKNHLKNKTIADAIK